MERGWNGDGTGMERGWYGDGTGWYRMVRDGTYIVGAPPAFDPKVPLTPEQGKDC